MPRPRPDDPIPLIRPAIDGREEEAVARVLRSGWVTQGPEVARFESEFAAAVGAPHACAVSSCTAALHLALLVAGVGPGDEVATVSHSFIATANAIRMCGAIPLFVDVEPGAFNVDPARLEASLTPRTRAVLCVHQLGMPCDLAAVTALGRRHAIPVIEDAACAAGSAIRWSGEWQPVGRPHGDIACFSFHPRKLLTTGDGGMITTANAEWDARCRLLRQHGMTVSDVARHASPTVTAESYREVGFNYRMTDIQAAVGREQLRKLAGIVTRRRALAARYRELLSGVDGVSTPVEPEWARSNWQSYCVTLAPEVDQRRVMQQMLDEKIATRRGVMCAHREPAYQQAPWTAGEGGLTESEGAQDRGVILPLFHDMTDHQQVRVVQSLQKAIRAVQPASIDRM
jgi:dTDP-4-amino-4,6-dideoxygalactose transaminase